MSGLLIQPAECRDLFLSQTPFLDVRAPVEFRQGSVPGAVNIPILTDSERHEIGTIYKQLGQAAAIARGHELVSGSVRESRIEAWRQWMLANPHAVLYCFRGGLRSQLSQEWLASVGIIRPRVAGGYKALRHWWIENLDRLSKGTSFFVVAGPTGSGKTEFLYQSGAAYVDLERAARHRGSAFGGQNEEQPSQVDFENALSLALLKNEVTGSPFSLLEDESRMVGRCVLPEGLFAQMQRAPVLLLDRPIAERVFRIWQEYVSEPLRMATLEAHFSKLRSSVLSIERKLGGVRTQEILLDLTEHQRELERRPEWTSAPPKSEIETRWIRKLLEWYYDPTYEKSLARRNQSPAFRGTADELREWIRTQIVK